MKVKRMAIPEILRRIWLFSANKIKSSEPFTKQPTQLIIAAHNCHKSALTDQSPNRLNSLVTVIYQLQKKSKNLL